MGSKIKSNKNREALRFVKHVKSNDILYAVIGEPERTVAPEVTGHLILISGMSARRYKMRKNTITFKHELKVVGKGATPLRKRFRGTTPDIMKVLKTNEIDQVIPNFIEVTGKELAEMFKKCNHTFKKAFAEDPRIKLALEPA